MYLISIKFEKQIYPNIKDWVVLYGDIRIPRWRTAAILNFDFWHNLGVDRHFCTKFGTQMENQHSKDWSKIRFSKIQDGGRPPS